MPWSAWPARRVRAALIALCAAAVAAPLVAVSRPATALEGDDLPLPTIVVYLHDAGGDAIDFYDSGAGADPVALTRAIAYTFGPVPDEPQVTDYRDAVDEFRAAGAQFDGRLPRRSGDELRLSFTTMFLSLTMARAGYTDYALSLCLPDVELDLRSSHPHGVDEHHCPQWVIGAHEPPVRVDAVLRPDASGYRTMLLAIVAATAIGVVIAMLIAMWLRRTVVRSFGAGSLVVAAIGVGLSLAASFTALLFLSFRHRPVSALVIAHDLAVLQQFSATVLPASFFAIPGVVLAVLALNAPVDASATQPVPPPSAPVQAPGLPTWL